MKKKIILLVLFLVGVFPLFSQENIEDNKVYIASERTIENYFYYIQAERKDVERLEVEYDE